MALEIIKNGLAKNKIRGPFRPGGGGGSRRNGPRTISKYFFIFELFPYQTECFYTFLHRVYEEENQNW